MSPHTRFQKNKIDVLDMLISILKSHEEGLSEFADRLENFIDNISLSQGKIAGLNQILQHENVSDIASKLDFLVDNISSILENIVEFTSENGHHLAIVDCRKWSEFRDASTGTSLVSFEIDMWNIFSIASVCRRFIFRYSEKLPASEDDVISEDSICRNLLNPDSLRLRRWLSEELNIPEEKIIEGNLLKTLDNTSERSFLKH